MSDRSKSVLRIEKVLREGWKTAKANLGFLIGLIFIIGAITIALSAVVGAVENQVFILFWNVVSMIVSLWLSLGAIRILLDLVYDKEVQFKALFSQGHHLLNFLVAAILYNLIVLGGLILLIVPGIIWGIKFQFFSYFIVDEGMGVMDSLRASSQITAGDKWNLFLLGLSIFVINFIGMLLLLVGLLVTYPLTLLALAYAYTHLKKAKFKKQASDSPASA